MNGQKGSQVTVHEHLGIPEPPPVRPANPRHSSKDADHRTPPEVVERVRLVLGGIDLDPFSSAAANESVGAREFFSGIHGGKTCVLDHEHGPGQTCRGPLDAVDGFHERWWGRVFCNPPGGRGPKNQSNQKRAWFKLVEEYGRGREVDGHFVEPVKRAVFVCFSVELLQTTQVKTPDGLPLPLDFPVCYPRRRVAYLTPDGARSKSPPHASCLVLLPERLSSGAWNPGQVRRFVEVFGELGRVVVPHPYPTSTSPNNAPDSAVLHDAGVGR